MKNAEAKELWIGDLLRSKVTGRTGTFEGIHSSGRLRIKSGNKFYLVAPRNVEKLEDDTEEDVKLVFEEENHSVKATDPSDTIDLHIEKFRPDLQNALPERILDIQLKGFEEFLADAKSSRQKILEIIHGRGEGVLRKHIRQILASDKDVLSYESSRNDGATRVYLF